MDRESENVIGDERKVSTGEFVQDPSTGEVLSADRARADAANAKETIGADSWREQQ